MDSPVMLDFVNNLDRINEIADASVGFVWRLAGDENNATALRVFEDDFMIINMSVWESLEALFDFTYKSGHVEIFTRKKEWFSAMEAMHMAFWYVPVGHTPSPEEAKQRLKHLNDHGETPYSFSFKRKFTVADALN